MKRSWLTTSPRRAVGEAVLAAMVLFLIMALIRPAPSDRFILMIVSSVLSVVWCALRFRPPHGSARAQVGIESASAVALGLAITTTFFGFALTGLWPLIPLSELAPDITPSWLERTIFLIGPSVVVLVASTGLYILVRLALRWWIFWRATRHTRFLWSLTQAILMAALLAASPLIVLLTVLLVLSNFMASNDLFQFLVQTAPALGLVMGLTVLGLLGVLPAALTIAFFSARRLTRRLETLAQAARALRNKAYGTRIVVEGQDEVAQLQHTFNNMAADLQQAIHAVQAERDAVQALLDQRRQLIANVSHELRTPVATLRGYLDSTIEHWNGTPPASLPHDLLVMQRETVRLQTLIDDLFTLARAEASTLEFKPQPTDINKVVRRCVEAVAPQAWQHNKVEVVTGLAPQQAQAYVDAARTEQIMFNLLHNAIRHTPPGGIVAASVGLEDQSVVIAVRDTGEGIAPADLPHVWERFYRTKNAHGSGAGLGLALVKELTETMGGSVAVESVVGQGSCFTVRLPRVTTRSTPVWSSC